MCPKPEFGGRRSIRAITTTNHSFTISNSYLVLIPINVQEYPKWDYLVPEVFGHDDIK